MIICDVSEDYQLPSDSDMLLVQQEWKDQVPVLGFNSG